MTLDYFTKDGQIFGIGCTNFVFAPHRNRSHSCGMTHTTSLTAAPASGVSRSKRRKDLVAVNLGNALACLGAIAIAVVIYAVLILLLRAISREDLALMPKGEKIAKILRIQ